MFSVAVAGPLPTLAGSPTKSYVHVRERIPLTSVASQLFFGPDEGTAEMMDWAATHARNRGAPWWKSFTTGKTAATHGGIPHDAYVLSLSVFTHRAFSLLFPPSSLTTR